MKKIQNPTTFWFCIEQLSLHSVSGAMWQDSRSFVFVVACDELESRPTGHLQFCFYSATLFTIILLIFWKSSDQMTNLLASCTPFFGIESTFIRMLKLWLFSIEERKSMHLHRTQNLSLFHSFCLLFLTFDIRLHLLRIIYWRDQALTVGGTIT